MVDYLLASAQLQCRRAQEEQRSSPSSACHIVGGGRSRLSSSRRSDDATVLTQGVELRRICHLSGARCGYRLQCSSDMHILLSDYPGVPDEA